MQAQGGQGAPLRHSSGGSLLLPSLHAQSAFQTVLGRLGDTAHPADLRLDTLLNPLPNFMFSQITVPPFLSSIEDKEIYNT